MSSSYAHAAAQKAISLIIAEASCSGQEAGYESVERSANEAVLDIFARYLRTLGAASRAAAQHARRSESNLEDVIVGLKAVDTNGVGVAHLLQFLEEEASEVAFPCNLSEFPVPPGPSKAVPATSAEARPPHVPDFLPPFPDRRTYVRTLTHNVRPADAPAAKKRRSKHKRQAQDSLLAFSEASINRIGEAAEPGPPPPPLPALPAEDIIEQAAGVRERSAGAGGSGEEGAEALLSKVPDVVVPGFPAVLQSSARLECSSAHAPSSQQMVQPGHQPSGAAAAATSNQRQAAILGLRHLHGLDGIDEGRGGHASADED